MPRPPWHRRAAFFCFRRSPAWTGLRQAQPEKAIRMFKQLLIIGCGNMGGAMLAGWLKAGENPARFAILDPALPEAPAGVTLYREAAEAEAAGAHDAVMLGFKPQQLRALAPGLQGLTGEGVTICSLLAGITRAQLADRLPRSPKGHVRVDAQPCRAHQHIAGHPV
jgi:Pyrroline-5-carboxylate reductase